MRIALLSDAHCNSVGLAACFDRIDAMEVDRVYFLGDAVGYFARPGAVLDLLRSGRVLCQQGNHEAMLLGELSIDPRRDRFYGLASQRRELDDASIVELTAWPKVREIDVDGARLLLSHGSPTPSITEYFYEDTPWQPPQDFRYAAVFMGHTHRPFVRREGDVQLVNVGSCGAPRDRGDMASFAVYDGGSAETTIYRVRFDVEKTLEQHGSGIAAETRALLSRRGDFFGRTL